MQDHRMSLARVMRYSMPAIVLAALGLPLSMYIPNFYVENMGVSATAAGLVFTLLRFWDVVTDPMLGWASDRFDTPFGRRRFWITLAVPILMISVFMVFVPLGGADAIYLAFWLFVLYIGWTMLQISHLAWAAELAGEYDERSRIMGWREIAVVFGMFAVLSIAAMLEVSVPNDMVQDMRAHSVRWMGLFIVILLPLTVAIAVLTIPEAKHVKAHQIHWRDGVKAIAENAPLRKLIISDFIYRAATGITGTLFLWFMAWRLDMARFASIGLALYFLSALAAMPAWMRITYWLGKHKAYVVSMVFPALASLPLLFLNGRDPVLAFFGPGLEIDIALAGLTIQDSLNWDQLFGFVAIVLYGAAYGAPPFLARAIIADVADEDHLRTGAQRTGLFYSLLTLTEKTGYAVAVGFSIFMLDVIGLNTGPGATNDADTIFRLAFIYVVLPVALFLIAAGVMWRFPLDKSRQHELKRRLEEGGIYEEIEGVEGDEALGAGEPGAARADERAR